MTLITCALCIEPYYALVTGEFACPCGQVLAVADIELETAQVWVVDASGALGYWVDRVALLVAEIAAYGLRVTAEDIARCGEEIERMGVDEWVGTQVR
ncbi:hypothetical protein L0F81_38790 [Streptomyces tricolor]|uniref:Threonine synthase n=1 Tax=Streptomyces tricolor TaxID=68277 RepID=A0ABS9JU96_9ACTN|nr:hypothetical protein [Streptomyces tricolor]MCG0069144.1 hypothetical protein [Streptomyces tricolor]